MTGADRPPSDQLPVDGDHPDTIRLDGFPLDRIGRAEIERLVPQKGAMCLLDSVVSLSAGEIVCRAVSHLDPANPLRASGRLGIVCGAEYGMQAAALHGALTANAAAPPGWVAALRLDATPVPRLDDPGFGVLTVTARQRARGPRGLLYAFRLLAGDGRELLNGEGTVALPATGTAQGNGPGERPGDGLLIA